ncbi:unnamed protein product [Parajaminaea phylloscopi]
MSGVSRSMSAIPPEELPILESLINIRNRLTALKKNSSEFVRAQDVQTLYQAVIKQVAKLNAIRDEREANEGTSSMSSSSAAAPSTPDPAATPSANNATSSSSSSSVNTAAAPSSSHNGAPPSASSSRAVSAATVASPSPAASSSSPNPAASSGPPPRAEVDASTIQSNRVDTTLQDVFSLLSLFFLTIGKSRETPATFSQLASMKQLLGHMAESGIYTEADLQPFEKRLAELRDIIRRDTEQGKHPAQLTKLMMRKLDGCHKVLQQLQGTLSVLSVELVPIHQKLVSIRRQIAAAAARPKPARGEIRKLQEDLRTIDAKRVDGKFLGPGGSSVPAGQAILVGLLEECFEICHDVVVRNDEVPMTLQPIYDRLTEIKGQLEHLVLTHRWTLRETDLWNYQVTLKEIDRLRVDGKFVDSEGKQPEGQLVLLYLLRRCYGLIYRLVASSEPISEELMPISNKLSTVSKCLKEVSKYGGPFTMRDLYPYRLALHQIENMKSSVLDKEGSDTGVRKWLGRDGSVPEGQAILKAQFEEVEQTINEMLNQDDDEDEDEDDEGSEGDWGAGSDVSGSVSDDDNDVASDSVGINSGLQSQDISMPASPSGEALSPGLRGLSAALLASSVGSGASPSSQPATPAATRPPLSQQIPLPTRESTITPGSVKGSAGFTGDVSPEYSPGLSANPLPPGAATLAVPKPGQTSLTAAAVSLDSMSSSPHVTLPHSVLHGAATSPVSASPQAGLSVPDGASVVSSTGASVASSSQGSADTTSGLAAATVRPVAVPTAKACPLAHPSSTSSSSVAGAELGQSPGSLEGEDRQGIAETLRAKLAMENA